MKERNWVVPFVYCRFVNHGCKNRKSTQNAHFGKITTYFARSYWLASHSTTSTRKSLKNRIHSIVRVRENQMRQFSNKKLRRVAHITTILLKRYKQNVIVVVAYIMTCSLYTRAAFPLPNNNDILYARCFVDIFSSFSSRSHWRFYKHTKRIFKVGLINGHHQ